MVDKKSWIAARVHYGFFAALVMLGVIYWQTYTTMVRVNRLSDFVNETNQSLDLIRNLAAHTQDAYAEHQLALTEARVMDPELFSRRQALLTRRAQQIVEAEKNSPLQLERALTIQNLLSEMLLEMEVSFGNPSNREIAGRSIKRKMERVRRKVRELEDDEFDSLKDRTQQVQQSVSGAFWFSMFSFVFALVILGGATLIIRRDRLALLRARDDAHRASLAKSDFLSNMSHEIRTPLNAILGMADVLASSGLNSEQARYVGVFQRAGKTLLSLINDILDLSKIESGRFEILPTAFRLSELIRNIQEIMGFRASEKGVHFKVQFPPMLDIAIWGDLDRVRQVLMNLVGNAIKFTPTGGSVEVTVATREERQRPTLLFSVKDTGIGIPSGKHKLVFGKFEQLHVRDVLMAAGQGKSAGTGLGLAISKQLVELMGGTIGFESSANQGSRFYFEIPYRTATDADLTETYADQAHATSALTVLGVDDSEDNRFVLESYFRATPHTLTLVASAEDAIVQAKTGAFDLILMDIHMPGKDGLTATREIRAWEAQSGLNKTPIVALSAYALREEQAKSLEAGCDLHLTKPIARSTLLRALNRYNPRQHHPSSAQQPKLAPGIDMSAMLSRYAENRRKDLAELGNAIARKDFEKIRKIGHNAKGTAATYGFPELGRVGAALEEAANAGNLIEVQRISQQFEAHCQAIVQTVGRGTQAA